jgi:radical SAM superfamily enzyme YgiQ (UPF0313 family)
MRSVLLIDPPFPERPWDINWLTQFPPKGLLYLAAALRDTNIEVKIIDTKMMQFERPSLLRRSIKEICSLVPDIVAEIKPQIVGITSSTLSYKPAIEVIKAVKKNHPKVMTVIGGVHVSFTAEETLVENPFIDVVVRGEGERTIVDIAVGKKLEEVEGVSFRDTKKQTIVHNPDRKPLEPEEIPVPAYDCVDMRKYSYVVLQCVRGCPHKCSFCEIPKLAGNRIRHRPAEKVLAEMELAFSLNPNLEIRLEDEFLGIDMQRARKILTGLSRKKLSPFRAAIRPEDISDEVLKLLKEAGCNNLYVGVESGSDKILKYNGRGFDIARLKTFMDTCRRNDMLFHAGFILGLPGETKETLDETLKFALECADTTFPIVKKHFSTLLRQIPYALIVENSRPEFNLLAPNPGTPIAQNPVTYKYNIFHKNWELYDCNTPVGEPDGISADYIVEFKKKALQATKQRMAQHGLPVDWWDPGYKG